MTTADTLLLSHADVLQSLTPGECREALERAFSRPGQDSRALGFEPEGGSFHVKATLLDGPHPAFVAKVNGNFPGNPESNGLPTIQGLLVLVDGRDGRPLAIMDSGGITALRTAAASVVAAQYLARAGADTLAIVGCGTQGRFHLDALLAWRSFRTVHLFDSARVHAEDLAAVATRRQVPARIASSVAEAVRDAAVIVTCTTGKEFVLYDGDVRPGAFVAAVGADNPRKREIHPALMAAARVVVDHRAQCAASGDLHHALEAGTMRSEDVHADLAEVVSGAARGRTHSDERFVFDSTGIALEDAAAAVAVLKNAQRSRLGRTVRFGE